ncbi:hypothetical protein [Flavobacterium sp.]|uniref:hypothetical protein n=1 Tax=Flavobacterium sp. TaxID=239 RepID=UPI0026313F99|nr:hypothetical protein [Flavobacterium sp.]
MTNNIEKIYNDLKLNFESAPEHTIDFYSKNSLTLNNIKTFKDKEDLRLFIEIVWQYLNAVYQKDRFNETVDFATKNLNLIDSELIRFNAEELKDQWYNGILHFKGMASYRLRDYKTSTPIYKYLTKSDPKNDSFKNWLNYSIYGQRLWLVNTINTLSGVLLLVYLFAKEYIENSEIRIAILLIAGIGLFGNWGYEYYMKRSFRKSTKTF